jgi:hypothetical protein
MLRSLSIIVLLIVGLLFSTSTTANAVDGPTRARVGLLGAGVSWHSPLAEHFDWGLKAEGGYLGNYSGITAQALIRFTIPAEHKIPLYFELGFGPRYAIGDESGLKPAWGSFAIGANFDGWSLFIQGGTPSIGVSFPM